MSNTIPRFAAAGKKDASKPYRRRGCAPAIQSDTAKSVPLLEESLSNRVPRSGSER